MLARAWLRIYGPQIEAKKDHILESISKPVGRMVMVYVGSLEGDGPTHIKVLCLDTDRLDGLVRPFYFGSTGQ